MRVLTASSADKYELYVRSVQDPKADVRFFSKLYQQQNGHLPITVREDFCGTAAISCEWVRSGAANRAIGVDKETEPLEWCRQHYQSLMPAEEGKRLTLVEADVLEVATDPVDVVLAPNTSICLLKKRRLLVHYCRRSYAALNKNGMLIVDTFAGPEAQRTGVDQIQRDGFTCLWDQADFNAVTNVARNHIHFIFPDGSRMMHAFTYEMRMWTPAELVDAMLETGLRDTQIFRKGSADAVLEPTLQPCQHADVTDAWDVYIVGFKSKSSYETRLSSAGRMAMRSVV